MDIRAQIDVFFMGRLREWKLFENIRKAICTAYPQTSLRVMKTCISFDDPKPYCYVSFPKRKSEEGLLLSISLKERVEHPRIAMITAVSKMRFTAHIPVRSDAEVDEEMLALIADSRR